MGWLVSETSTVYKLSAGNDACLVYVFEVATRIMNVFLPWLAVAVASFHITAVTYGSRCLVLFSSSSLSSCSAAATGSQA